MAISLKAEDVAWPKESKGLDTPHLQIHEITGEIYSNSETSDGSHTMKTAAITKPPPENTQRRKRVLLSTESAFASNFLPPLIRSPDIELRLITDEESSAISTGATKVPHYMDSVESHTFDNRTGSRRWLRAKAAELCLWADLLIVAPIDAGTLGSMLYGLTHTLTLSLLRGWDMNKPVFLVPGMTVSEWTNPLTERQLQELEHNWPWIVRIPPLLWNHTGPEELTPLPWDGSRVFEDMLQKMLDLTGVSGGQDANQSKREPEEKLETKNSSMAIAILAQQAAKHREESQSGRPKTLPLELWLNIFVDHLGDWEIAKAVGIPTNLPVPREWQPHILKMSTPPSLEYTILRGSFTAITSKIKELTPYTPLSNLACHLIFKFSRTDILTYLLEKHPSLYNTTTRFKNIPYLASAIYGNPTILTWWRDSPDSSTQEHSADAMDGASRSGHINVLDWWLSSGLPLRYSERALESASAEERVDVLEWWKNACWTAPASRPHPFESREIDPPSRTIRLKRNHSHGGMHPVSPTLTPSP